MDVPTARAPVAGTGATVRPAGAGAARHPLDDRSPRWSESADRGTRRSGRAPARQVVAAYVALTKPRIIELLLVVTVPVMFLAAAGVPRWQTVLATLFGGSLAAGSANALNCYLDRDIDAAMRRTRGRPLPAHAVPPSRAVVFGLVLGVVSTVWLALAVNVLSAALTLAANAFYLALYTAVLKRRTWQNVVWGGAAGCAPALIGWTAVTGHLAWPPVVLFAVVFCWTPPHTWALGIRYREDYAAAGVPMLPVVAGPRAVGRQVLAYSAATVVVSLLLVPVGEAGALYGVVALGAGTWLVVESVGLLRRAARLEATDPDARMAPSDRVDAVAPMRLFHVTNAYLALVFLAVAADTLLR